MKRLFLLLLVVIPLASYSQKASRSSIQLKPFPALPPRNIEIDSYLASFPEMRSLSSNAREWFYWTNYSRRNPKAFWDSVVVPILNTYPQFNTSYAASLKKDLYKAQKLPMIKPNLVLIKVAQAHAVDLSKKGDLSHSSSNGTPFQRRVFSGGIQKCAAENLSLGIDNPVFSLVLLYLDEGISDLGHRVNLLSPFYVEMGIGISKTKSNSIIVVQDFACDQTGG